MRRQYLALKLRYPHAVLLFRLGDFYEAFDDDAQVVARELGLALTSRPVGKGKRVPMAGIPHHALEGYVARLIAKGYKVAICEQTETPGKGKRLLARDVVRVTTPGTVVEEAMLDGRVNNYLAAVVQAGEEAGLAYADISTGEFACTQLPLPMLTGELERLRPAELLAPEGWQGEAPCAITTLPKAIVDEEGVQRLLQHFQAPGLDALGLVGKELAALAAAALLRYVEENAPAALRNLGRLRMYNPSSFMLLDSTTRRNLEIFRPLSGEGGPSLVSVLDLTRTPMGARLLRRWLGQPLLDVEAIRRRQDGVELFYSSAVRRGRVARALDRFPDVERILGRVAAGRATPRDLVALARALEAVPDLREALDCGLGRLPPGLRPLLEDFIARLRPCHQVAHLLAQALVDDPPPHLEEGEVIRPGFSQELDEVRTLARDARQILAQLEQREREETGIRTLKLGFNRVFGYYLEVSKANLHLVPPRYERRQTLVGAERFITPELKELEYKILQARERQLELEREIFGQVCAQVAAEAPHILETMAVVAEVDVYCALAEAAACYGYVRPHVDQANRIYIKDGRHPVVERVLGEGRFVPNDTDLSNDEAQIIVLTGPNMAGKSTYLRQVALIVLMAQVGSFVPAREAHIGVVDRIFTRIGAMDDIAAGRSTFMVEMVETAAILHNATPRSLLLFDEIGRGTSTFDGLAIARAVVEFLHNEPQVAAKTLFATHYHELTELASFLPRVRNYNVAVAEEEGSIVFLYRIVPGGADRSYGVQVAQLAGLPRAVVARAQQLLEELEAARDRRPRRPSHGLQLPLMAPGTEVAHELASLELDAMTPLQALTKLYELRERARRAIAGGGA